MRPRRRICVSSEETHMRLLGDAYEHSKMLLLSYDSLKMQSYFISSVVSTKQAKSIFKFRAHMSNVKEILSLCIRKIRG